MEVSPEEYYRHLYPYDQLVRLLTQNGDELPNIEFAIEGSSPAGDKFYRRYLSVKTAKELKAEVSNFPHVKTFHFGAVYTGKPSGNARVSVPVRRVLSFDIDLTDKEWIPLKENGDVSLPLCDRAWPVCAASVDLLKRVLEMAFGYTQLLVVYSGRRGAHVHVFDEGAMSLNSEGRAAIIGYVNGTTGTDKLRSTSGVHLVMKMHNLRKHVHRLFKTLFVVRMGILDTRQARLDFLARLDLEKYASLSDMTAMLVPEVVDKETGKDAWKCIVQHLEGAKQAAPWVLDRLDCAVLAYVWPMLDTNVTRDIAHLTKVPFACHAKTGRVACAVAADELTAFEPGQEAPSLVSWNQDNMDDALFLFDGRKEAMAEAGISEAERRGEANWELGEQQEQQEDPEVAALSDSIMAELERKAEAELSEPDVEDLVGPSPRSAVPANRAPRKGMPRKTRFKRKQSPLVPQE
jgi:predicted DNA primase small subunit